MGTLEKELENAKEKMKEDIKEIPNIKKDRKKTFLVFVISVALALIMKNVIGVQGYGLLPLGILTTVSILSGALIVIQTLRIFYYSEMQEIIKEEEKEEKKEEKQKK